MRRECRERFPRRRGLAVRHVSWHVRGARTVIHAGIANYRFAALRMHNLQFPVSGKRSIYRNDIIIIPIDIWTPVSQ